MTGLIFDIQRYALHDGPGIRTTVFLKGCPLDCAWCHNPESRAGRTEAMLNRERCAGCGACVEICPEQAVRLDEGGRSRTDRTLCTLCGTCLEHCPENAREICGYRLEADALVERIMRDRIFHERSGGGVTFSGGEPLAQPDFLAEVLGICRSRGLHTAVDTSGHVPRAALERILERTDLFLFDLKHMDDARHRELTGVPNVGILSNLDHLARAKCDIIPRVPVIPGLNDDDANLSATADRLIALELSRVELLPYHAMGRGKAARLDRDWPLPDVVPPSPERMHELGVRFEAAGLEVSIGGSS